MRLALILQGSTTAALSGMALALTAAVALSGAQWLNLTLMSAGVAALTALIALAMFVASAKLGLHSRQARRLTVLGEVILIAPGVALAAIGNYLTENAGSPNNPGTDGPFADGADGLIALTGMAYASGAVLVLCLLLLAPTVRRGFLGPRAHPGDSQLV